MSRQMCASQDDLAHTVAEILLTTGNEKKVQHATGAEPRDSARNRAPKALASETATTGSTSARQKHSSFLKLIKHTAGPTAVHMKPFSGRVRNSPVFWIDAT